MKSDILSTLYKCKKDETRNHKIEESDTKNNGQYYKI